jgi:hypothetical protein
MSSSNPAPEIRLDVVECALCSQSFDDCTCTFELRSVSVFPMYDLASDSLDEPDFEE